MRPVSFNAAPLCLYRQLLSITRCPDRTASASSRGTLLSFSVSFGCRLEKCSNSKRSLIVEQSVGSVFSSPGYHPPPLAPHRGLDEVPVKGPHLHNHPLDSQVPSRVAAFLCLSRLSLPHVGGHVNPYYSLRATLRPKGIGDTCDAASILPRARAQRATPVIPECQAKGIQRPAVLSA
ncbi:hypothetical protein CRENBAI_010356 [Crenichthys baileyi]|uniref:Uncharacterized protein n=1 Tax=Crenichthys baileyi TaxID=28760 RepID=A0AAV9R032_9TELE